MTSNDYLLPGWDHGIGKSTARLFVEMKLPFIICTDDDGIWIIHKCAKHYRHTSVGAEICKAISHKSFPTFKDLENFLGDKVGVYAFKEPTVRMMKLEDDE
eukprot:CAMPEP_0184362224 /NCGR_PEP_ID=MMETSP1089-20130417/133847_1 /TAXON_ID=38269 ORGANISM="Gloeochaete wittrockiana, Strain SAG46.84" /NCGR_SAMPLE_ID=MMETSP1089 /ASSEMBLY_ACC=CAM_ASM_000445 /LENGTH=100 /DNA_ID=CAMNT_0026702225 /DNA_START=270 /DNA_END=572 /DNA_ORIENTATION=+